MEEITSKDLYDLMLLNGKMVEGNQEYLIEMNKKLDTILEKLDKNDIKHCVKCGSINVNEWKIKDERGVLYEKGYQCLNPKCHYNDKVYP